MKPLLSIVAVLSACSLSSLVAEILPGTVRWSTTLADAIQPVDSSPALGADSTVYVAVTTSPVSGELYAVKGANFSPGPAGSVRWKMPLAGPVVSSPVVNRDGSTVFICTQNGLVYYFHSDGTPVVPTGYPLPNGAGSAINSTPALGLSGNVLYITCDDGFLYALDVSGSSPSILWQANIGCQNSLLGLGTASPAIGSDGTVYAIGLGSAANGYPVALWIFPGGTGDNAFAIDESTASDDDADFSSASVSIGPSGTVYAGTDAGGVAVFNPAASQATIINSAPISGAMASGAGSNALPANSGDITTPIVDRQGNIYWVDVISGGVYCYTPQAVSADGVVPLPSAALKWSYRSSHPIQSTPALGADRFAGLTLWAMSSDGHLLAFNAASGVLQGFTPNPVTLDSNDIGRCLASPIVGKDGSVYAVYNKKLYCVAGNGSAPVTVDFWPSFRGNAHQGADVRHNRWTDSTVTSVAITALPPLSPGGATAAAAVNDGGLVAGSANNTAVIFNPSVQIGTAPSSALSIDLSGDAVGYGSSTAPYAFYWNFASASASVLSPPAGSAYAAAQGISPTGFYVVGKSSQQSNLSVNRAAAWTVNGGVVSAGLDLGGFSINGGQAFSVNDSGLVVGTSLFANGLYHGFVYGLGALANYPSLVDIGALVNPGNSSAITVNGFCQVAGWTLSSGNVAIPFYKNLDYGTMPQPRPESVWRTPVLPSGFTGGSVSSINCRGQMVGTGSTTQTGQFQSHAFVWTPGNPLFSMKDLNDFLSTTQKSQWFLQSATSISDDGTIVGMGLLNHLSAAYILKPN